MGVAAAFGSDGREFAVTGQNVRFVWQGEKAGADGVQQGLQRTTGQVGASDTAGKQSVSRDYGVLDQKRDVTGRVSRREQHLDFRFPQRQRLLVFEIDGGSGEGTASKPNIAA